MKRRPGLLLLLLLAPLAAARTAAPRLDLPGFPRPALVQNEYGETKTIGFLHFLHQLQDGGVQELDDVDFLDENYAELTSASLPTLAAWLEAACHSVGVELQQSRRHHYDGMAYAQLLEVATSLAAAREIKEHLAMPIGVLICKRRQPWGDLPGDGARDAYLLIATERGLLVYDPPTRQLSLLTDFPNSSDVYKIQF
jgi:hypothetical protein